MTLKEYKAKKMQDPEFARAYEEIQPEMEALRGGMDLTEEEQRRFILPRTENRNE